MVIIMMMTLVDVELCEQKKKFSDLSLFIRLYFVALKYENRKL